jgi:hypothetical protein
MEYEKFKGDYDKYMDWKTPKDFFKLDSAFMSDPLKGAEGEDNIYAAEAVPFEIGKDVISFSDYKKSDSVNSPAHYTRGKQEAIDTIEEAIQDAPSVESGMLQAQVLKYLLRLWLKDNPTEDAKKAQWYLNRLISKLES